MTTKVFGISQRGLTRVFLVNQALWNKTSFIILKGRTLDRYKVPHSDAQKSRL